MKKFKNFRAKALAVFMICTALLTSCGSSDSSTSFSETTNIKGAYDAVDDGMADDFYAEGGYDESNAESGGASGDNTVSAEEAVAKKNDESGNDIDREMLVYSCTMNVDVLDFDKASEQFRTKLDQYQGFVESENLSDGGSSGRWYNENEEKWHTYTATVRVPSRVYNDFCDAVAELGDLRSRNASVENVSGEYRDLSTTLEIYERKEERYLELLAAAKDEANAIAIEDKLTDIQVEIAKFKTRMNQIKTDVAYSYVYVTINEVKEYSAEPVHNDTFFQRFSNNISLAWSGFLDFLEVLLYVLIYLLPYIILFGVVILVTVKIIKSVKRKKSKAKNADVKSTEKNDSKPEE